MPVDGSTENDSPKPLSELGPDGSVIVCGDSGAGLSARAARGNTTMARKPASAQLRTAVRLFDNLVCKRLLRWGERFGKDKFKCELGLSIGYDSWVLSDADLAPGRAAPTLGADNAEWR